MNLVALQLTLCYEVLKDIYPGHFIFYVLGIINSHIINYLVFKIIRVMK